MMAEPPRVVFDCNVYFQALISPLGPAAKCLVAAARGQALLFCSEATIAELLDISRRPALRQKFHITDDRVEALIEAIREVALFVTEIAEVYENPFDPDDSHYVNLAVACAARLIVSRDGDLLRLMDPARPEGREFKSRFPHLAIIPPDMLLRELQTPRDAAD